LISTKLFEVGGSKDILADACQSFTAPGINLKIIFNDVGAPVPPGLGKEIDSEKIIPAA
jgi:hypothetical protein